jgi:hypothetical protein
MYFIAFFVVSCMPSHAFSGSVLASAISRGVVDQGCQGHLHSRLGRGPLSAWQKAVDRVWLFRVTAVSIVIVMKPGDDE